MADKRFPWKSNFRNTPPKVQAELEKIDSELVVVATVKKLLATDVASGVYSHLGLDVDPTTNLITARGAVDPTLDAGKWSLRNAMGWDRKRPDLPMVQKTYVFDTPNFGDAATYGTHTHVWTRDVYQHQVFEPQGMKIEPTVMSGGQESALVKFALTPELSRSQPEFDLMLLWSLNVLQENVGATGVFSSTATKAEFIRTIQLHWEVFPPGTIEEVVAWFKSKPSAAMQSADFDKHLADRAAAFNKLKPEAYIRGSGQFGSYFGAKFADDLVVFENLRYGNALYILYEDWDEISKRSRLDLLRDHDAKFDRIIHSEDWQSRFSELIRREIVARRRGKGRH